MSTAVETFAEFPYPGERPDGSYVLDADGTVLALAADPRSASGWRVETGQDLDAWLADRGAAPLEERVAVLSFGSNASPPKVLRNAVALPAVQLAADLVGLAAVWCAGRRHLDDAVPATLAPRPGHREPHVLSYVLPTDLGPLDRVEGHPEHYRRQRLTTGQIIRADGLEPADVLAYIGVAADRVPVLDDQGDPVLVRDGSGLAEAQRRAQRLVERATVRV